MKINRNTTLAIGILVTGLFAGVANAEDQPVKKAVESAQTAFFDMIDKDSVVVNFEKDSAAISEGERTTMKSALDAARKDIKIERVIVASWSDSSMPEQKDAKLSDRERKLADERAENVQKLLKEFGVSKVDTYSMAEQANWFQKMFKTDEAQIKKSMKGLAIDDNFNKALGEKLTSMGGPSKAAVIILTDRSYMSH